MTTKTRPAQTSTSDPIVATACHLYDAECALHAAHQYPRRRLDRRRQRQAAPGRRRVPRRHRSAERTRTAVSASSCVWVECDGERCDRDKGWPDEGPFHFNSEQAVLEYGTGEVGMGWTRLPDGRLLCRGCSQDADCEATGHEWTGLAPRLQERTAPTGSLRRHVLAGGRSGMLDG